MSKLFAVSLLITCGCWGQPFQPSQAGEGSPTDGGSDPSTFAVPEGDTGQYEGSLPSITDGSLMTGMSEAGSAAKMPPSLADASIADADGDSGDITLNDGGYYDASCTLVCVVVTPEACKSQWANPESYTIQGSECTVASDVPEFAECKGTVECLYP